jgi:hypothetical protein
MKNALKTQQIIKAILAIATAVGFTACAINGGRHTGNVPGSAPTLEPASRIRHNPLLPASAYDGNHEISS